MDSLAVGGGLRRPQPHSLASSAIWPKNPPAQLHSTMDRRLCPVQRRLSYLNHPLTPRRIASLLGTGNSKMCPPLWEPDRAMASASVDRSRAQPGRESNNQSDLLRFTFFPRSATEEGPLATQLATGRNPNLGAPDPGHGVGATACQESCGTAELIPLEFLV
jgi:hypothetical protein